MYRPVLVTAPTEKPISRDEAKAQLDIDYTEKDTLIDALIAAATAHLDGWAGILGRCLCEQEWRQDYDDFASCMRLPLFPVIEIVSVKYIDTDGVEQTVDAADYNLRTDERGAYVEFVSTYSFPSLNVEGVAVSISYVAGYENNAVDDAIKQAMLMLVRHWFDNPSPVVVNGTAVALPFAVDALLAPFRRVRL